jgi:hypothetical protein
MILISSQTVFLSQRREDVQSECERLEIIVFELCIDQMGKDKAEIMQPKKIASQTLKEYDKKATKYIQI